MIRIAVIGGGPKCLFALLALHDLIPAAQSRRISVDVYDPLPPGAGSVWRVTQPEVLRLNVNAGIVDASSSLSQENFTRWIARVAPERSKEKYPPRVFVGRYLNEQFQLLYHHGNIGLTHIPLVVTGVERHGSRWRVSGPLSSQEYDEVLLATGHGATGHELAGELRPDPLAGALNSSPLMGDYTALNKTDVAGGAEVWIRGAALTAYDVALLLTEGRGGTWQPSGDGSDGVLYIPSGEEPRRITFFSRSGALMEPKPEHVPAEISPCLDVYRQRLRQWGVQTRDPNSDAGRRPSWRRPAGRVLAEHALAKQVLAGQALAGMWRVLLECAMECARLMGAPTGALELWRTALTGDSVSASPDTGKLSQETNAAVLLRNSLCVNQLRAPVTTGWIWARVWSGLYAELVVAMDRLPRTTGEWRLFTRVARNLEKFTFGPPELTARKLVALLEAGILHVAGAGEKPPAGAVLADAVTPGPGLLRRPAPEAEPNSDLAAQLLRAGEVMVRPGERGLLTDLDGTCLARDGSRNERLAALGRPTEDPTLGHDTLNRSLHGEYRLWAQRVAAHAATEPDS